MIKLYINNDCTHCEKVKDRLEDMVNAYKIINIYEKDVKERAVQF